MVKRKQRKAFEVIENMSSLLPEVKTYFIKMNVSLH